MERTRKSRRRLFIFPIFLIFFIVIGGFIFTFFFWQRKDIQTNLAIRSSSGGAAIVGINPTEKTIRMMIIPTGTLIETAAGYGTYRIESIYPLGELDGRGWDLLKESLEKHYGLPIDGWIDGQSYDLEAEINEEKVKSIISSLFSSAISGRVKTSFSIVDLIGFYFNALAIPPHRVDFLNLKEIAGAEEVKLPDGQRAVRVEVDRSDQIVRKWFADSRIREEGKAIAVLNGTDHSGLGAQAARILENIGGKIIRVGQGPAEKNYCLIQAEPNDRQSYTFKKISRIFQCRSAEGEREYPRAEIVVIVGKEYWQKLNRQL